MAMLMISDHKADQVEMAGQRKAGV